jgi:hypothetical protein
MKRASSLRHPRLPREAVGTLRHPTADPRLTPMQRGRAAVLFVTTSGSLKPSVGKHLLPHRGEPVATRDSGPALRGNHARRDIGRQCCIVAAAATRSLLLPWQARVKKRCAWPASTPPTPPMVRGCRSERSSRFGANLETAAGDVRLCNRPVLRAVALALVFGENSARDPERRRPKSSAACCYVGFSAPVSRRAAHLLSGPVAQHCRQRERSRAHHPRGLP